MGKHYKASSMSCPQQCQVCYCWPCVCVVSSKNCGWPPCPPPPCPPPPCQPTQCPQWPPPCPPTPCPSPCPPFPYCKTGATGPAGEGVNRNASGALSIGSSVPASSGAGSFAAGPLTGIAGVGQNALCLGNLASAAVAQPANSVVINGSGVGLNGILNGTTLAPVNTVAVPTATQYPLYYDETTKQILYVKP